ncbi:MAG: hypothetical protein EPO68_11245 [Planctomycetota bacterium]|nr:MAG: hypothetical protein EPO68_11245 [Planctomycetota bacterium]
MRPPLHIRAAFAAALVLAPALARAQTAPPAQGGAAAARADEPIATLDGAPLALAAYKDYLWAVQGASALDDFVHHELVARSAARAGFAVDDAALDADFAPYWARTVAQDPGGESAVLARIEEQGRTLADVRRSFRIARRLERGEDFLCQRTRVIDAAAIAARFDRDYGKGGVKVELAHVFLNRAAMRAQLVERGVPLAELGLDRLDRELAARAAELVKRLGAGESFDAVAREASHDQSTRASGGAIDGYNYDRFGEQLANAVRAAEVGVPFGPVQGAAGLHIGLVKSRVVTQLADVRDELIQQLARDPASSKERLELRQKLRAESKVERGPAATR